MNTFDKWTFFICLMWATSPVFTKVYGLEFPYSLVFSVPFALAMMLLANRIWG